jgi:hypothetical protein
MPASRRLLGLGTALAVASGVLVVATPASAEGTGTISGTVSYPADATPTVLLYQFLEGTFTGIGQDEITAEDNGTWSFEGLDAGQYRLSVREQDAVEEPQYSEQFFNGVYTDDADDSRIITATLTDGQVISDITFDIAKRAINMPAAVILGDKFVGGTVVAFQNNWEPDDIGIGYEWQRNGVVIEDADSDELELTEADLGKKIKLRVFSEGVGFIPESYTTASITVAAGKLATVTPKIKGTPAVGKKLKAVPGKWTAKTKFSYQWYAGSNKIKKATKSTFKVTSAQVGKKISVKVTGKLGGYKTVVKKTKSTKKVK